MKVFIIKWTRDDYSEGYSVMEEYDECDGVKVETNSVGDIVIKILEDGRG